MGVEENGAMLQGFPVLHQLGVSGKLHALDREIISALQNCRHPEIVQNGKNWSSIASEIHSVVLGIVHQETEVEITQIMKDGAASGQASHHRDLVFLNPLIVDLGEGILEPAYDDARFVYVEQEAILMKIVQDVFFQSYIEGRVIRRAEYA
jgi:hypothetical protein